MRKYICESVLESTKKALGIASEYSHFDEELIMHINTVFFSLFQLGVFSNPRSIVSGDELWDDFINGRDDLEAIKSYVYLRVRLLFDPPASASVGESFKKQIDELEWRLNVEVDTGEG